MSTQFLPKLSQNFLELLEDDEYYDITIEVGEDPNVKIFRAHMNILFYRSPYLRRTLASNKKNNDLTHIKLPNISPGIFRIILKYIYGGILSLNVLDTSNILKVLIAADELFLQELVDYLQKYLIEYKSEWMEQHFELIHRTSFQSNNLLELRQFCTDLMAKSPEKIFKSFDFTSLPETALVQLIKKDELQMKEVEVWEHVLKWGFAQNPTLATDPNTWTDDDFETMENSLQHCLPLVRFFSLSSKVFSQKVRPYKKLLNHKAYEELLDFYLDRDYILTINILPPRNFTDSKIVNSSIISTISRWIDKIDNTNFADLYLPYKFELLLRGSRDGFAPKNFHTLCDGKLNTVTFIKVKETKEILGGYNPIVWASSGGWGKTKDSFIFSFKNEDDFDAIISNVVNMDCAVWFSPKNGPQFGEEDIDIYASNESTDYNTMRCKKWYYEKHIRDTENNFSIEDYEVFQIIRK